MPCGVFRWTLVYFGVYTDRSNLLPSPREAQKDNSLNHSCVSPKMGCLEYTILN